MATMLRILLLVFATAILFSPSATAEEFRWFKGNTHTHSLWSDGNDFPEMIADWYKKNGYHFLTLSDHNVLSRGEKWMRAKAIEKRRRALGPSVVEKYVRRFGDKWVEKRGEGDAVEIRLKTLKEIRPLFESEGEFLLIEGEEITDRYEKVQIHINAINLQKVIKPQHGSSVSETIRNNLKAVMAQEIETGKPILPHINHPNFQWSLTADDIAGALEERFFEVYNGHPGINHLGRKDRPGDEAIWDIANTLRLTKYKSRPLYGLATDDSHTYHGGDVSPGRGWVMVRCETLDADKLIKAMRAGEFYASSGVALDDIQFQDKTLSFSISANGDEVFTTEFIGTRKSEPKKTGVVLATATGLKPTYKLTGDELYVRATVTSSKGHPNPSFEGQKKQAWVQPVGWTVDGGE